MDWKQIGTGVLFAIGMLCLGFTLGGVVGGRVIGDGAMGWDRLASTIGGVIVGVFAAVVLTGAFVSRLTHRQRITTAVISVLISSVLVLIMQRMPGPSP